MTRVLFLAYYFPPVGGAGVQRSVKFARYLPEHGYEPVVVTGPGEALGRWSPRDDSLGGELDGVEVRRITEAEPSPSSGRRGRLERWLRLPSPFRRWWVDGAVAAGAKASEIDLVYASMSPYESADAAAALARRLGVPWVADLRDPWALDEMLVFPTALHRRLERARMGRALSSAAAIVMNTEEAAAQLRRSFPPLDAARITTIPNGYDAADFEGVEPDDRPGEFAIVHTGYLHTQLGRSHRRGNGLRRLLGGAADVDILTRSHVYLLRAIESLRERRPELAAAVRVHLVGLTSEADRAAVTDPAVELHGYVSHEQAIAWLRSASLLFLPMQNLPASVRATIVPGKTYEYLAAKRPVLAAVPDGDARDLLAAAGNAYLCRPDDVEAMATAIETELEHREGRAGPAAPDPAVVDRFERRRLTQELARVFDRVLGAA